MPDALKDIYDRVYLQRVADQFSRHHNGFNKVNFLNLVFDQDWEGRELKARMAHIRTCIHETLNLPYSEAVPVICNTATEFGGYEAMFFPDYVEAYGADNWDVSLPALEWLTRFSSSEFAVRPFIISDKERMMTQMNQWAEHENYHVRRLASEGCRPRLPWAQALPDFKKDPTLVLPILDKLKSDETDYVRRSVANNLNDIAKDNPQVTVDWTKVNKGSSEYTDWIIKHGCRTLLKQAEPQVMELFGYGDAESFSIKNLTLKKGAVRIGEELEFGFLLTSDSDEQAKFRLEYEIGYLKANGKHSYKVFKISEGDYMEKDKSFQRRQSFKAMTTRKHYPGVHWLKIKVNGVEKQSLSFMLLEG